MLWWIFTIHIIYNLSLPFQNSSFPYLSTPNWCLFTVSSLCTRNTNPWKSLSQWKKQTNPKQKNKAKKSHSEVITDINARNGVICMHIPNESPEFIPTNSNSIPKCSLIKLFAKVMNFFFFNESYDKPMVILRAHKETFKKESS